jgi:hypothetical protein
MAASLPGATAVQNGANPSQGRFVTFDPLSGPKGSPLGGRTLSFDANNHPVYTPDATNLSTGALATGIGFGDSDIINVGGAAAIFAAGFNDNDIPGERPVYAAGGPPPVVSSSVIDSTRMYIGGGRSTNTGAPNPYTAGIALCGAGNGGSRDGGAGPAFLGFPMKMVTATGAVANGAAIETGWTNRSGVSLKTGESCFGSGTAALAAAS